MHLKLLLNIILIGFLISSCSKNKVQQLIDNPSSDNSSLPHLFTDNKGIIFMSWVEQDKELATLLYSKFLDKSWSAPIQVDQSNEWFVNWADYPSIIAFDGDPMATHWLKKIPGNTYSYNVEIATFHNDQFLDPIVPHLDNTATEHGFVSMTPTSDSTFYTIWLDGRNTIGGHDEHGDLSSSMTLRGALLSLDGQILSEAELDASVCDCCNTSIAKTNSGLIAAYRNRTENEVRDIYISKYVNGVWQSPKSIFNDNWEIAACPVNGPSIDVFDKSVAVAWFTGANDKPMVKLAFSLDEGDSFLTPIIIDSTSSLGRVDVIANNDKTAWVSWMSRNTNGGQLNLRQVSINGETIAEFVISDMNPSRGSGFPQITSSNDGILVAWTELSGSNKSIKTAFIQ